MEFNNPNDFFRLALQVCKTVPSSKVTLFNTMYTDINEFRQYVRGLLSGNQLLTIDKDLSTTPVNKRIIAERVIIWTWLRKNLPGFCDDMSKLRDKIKEFRAARTRRD